VSEAAALRPARRPWATASAPHVFPTGRIGPRLALLGLAIGLAAVNTGNNLLYLILSLLLALAAISVLVSSWSLRRLRVSALLPGEVVCGEPFHIGVEACGRFPLLPQTWIEVRLEGLPAPVDAAVVITSGRQRGVASARAVVERRGVFEPLTLSAATGYPLDLWLRRSRRQPWRGALVVLPRHPKIRSLRIVRAGQAPPRGDAPSHQGGHPGVDLRNIRSYTTSDDARHIDWRSSARSGRLMVREFEREQERRIDLVLDLEAADDEAFEQAVQRCAAILDLARRERYDARLLLAGIEVAPGGIRAMRCLASVKRTSPEAAGPPGSGLVETLGLVRPDAECVVISADPARSTPIEMA
jgi:uncharacterized protein (DUF58 family)